MTPPESSRRVLSAILMNPPVGRGAASLRHLDVARRLLRCDELQISNLFSLSTASVTDITEAGQDLNDWTAAREPISRATGLADEIVLAWGLGGFNGIARQHFRTQVEWVVDDLARRGVDHVWTVGDRPRHPSRWHQFVSDRHGRTGGGTFEDRLRQVLHRVPVSDFVLN